MCDISMLDEPEFSLMADGCSHKSESSRYLDVFYDVIERYSVTGWKEESRVISASGGFALTFKAEIVATLHCIMRYDLIS